MRSGENARDKQSVPLYRRCSLLARSLHHPVPANGGGLRLYTFANTAAPGTTYTVTITTQPSSQICTLTNASGTIASAPVINISATCVAGPAGLNWDDGSWDDADWQ